MSKSATIKIEHIAPLNNELSKGLRGLNKSSLSSCKLYPLNLTLLLLLLTIITSAQTAQQQFTTDMKVISKSMKEINAFHAKTEVEVKVSGILLKRTSEIKKLGTSTWTKTEGIENIFTSEHIISVLTDQKLINYSKGIRSKKIANKATSDIIPILDSAAAQFDSIHIIKLNNGNKKYTLHSTQQIFSKIELELTKDLKYKAMVYHYNPLIYGSKGSVKINFILWNESPTIDPIIYKLENYITNKGKELIPAKKYQGFQVLENTESLK